MDNQFDLPSAQQIQDLEIGRVPIVIELMNAAVILLVRRLAAAKPIREASPAPGGDDVMLTVAEAAAILRKSTKWLYRHHDLPFIRKVGGGLLISKRGLEKWLERQKPHD